MRNQERRGEWLHVHDRQHRHHRRYRGGKDAAWVVLRVASLLLSLVFFQATAHDIPMQPRTAIG